MENLEKLTLKSGDAFIIADERGDFPASKRETGFFWHGTRYLRTFNLLLTGQPPTTLSYTIADEGNACHVDMINPTLSPGQRGEVLAGTVYIHRLLTINDHRLTQTISLTSYYHDPVRLELSLKLEADFVDMFEVRGYVRYERGEQTSPVFDQSSALFSYRGLDNVQRETRLEFSPPADSCGDKTVSWHVELSEGRPAQVQVIVTASEQYEQTIHRPTPHAHAPDARPSDAHPSEERTSEAREVHRYAPARYASPQPLTFAIEELRKKIHTSDHFLNQLLLRGMHDLSMLCAVTPQGLFPYAGIPWFACPFGRDALITSLQFLPWFPEVAQGTLSFLAAYQGKKHELFNEEEPGKILHEFRYGEMANCREIPYIPYYGSIDATPLFLITLESYIRWTNDSPFLEQIWPSAQAAAHWIIESGDPDGDTFLESRTVSQRGLVNQGWKDSHDAISHADGRLAEAPIALCEVQAYTYAAYHAMSYLAGRLGKAEEATRWLQAAETLQKNFLQQYWWEDESVFYLALDGEKRPCAVVTSNSGQCLWTGIVPDDLAKRMIARLMGDDMYSGWGIRTLSTYAARFNPMSYHNGSIWPHDTALVGAGFARYDRKDEAGKLLGNLAYASRHYDRARLPELYDGFKRNIGQGPIPYPVACEPQAWAAGAPFMLLSAILGLEPDAEHNCLTMRRPTLPDWLKVLELHSLRLGGHQLDIRFEGSNQNITSVLSKEKEITLQVLI